MCYHDMPTKYPPLDWSGFYSVIAAVIVVLAILATANHLFAPLHKLQAIHRHAVTASAAVEPQVWR